MTPAALLARELALDPARPLLTWYDDDAGARVELSVATSANWAAKIAGWLVDEHDLQPGDVVGLRAEPHWCNAVTALGAWTAGVGVELQSDAVLLDAAPDAMGAGLAALVGGQPDRFVPMTPLSETAPALVVAGRRWSQAELVADAERAAREHGLDARSRLLSVLDYSSPTGLDVGLIVPLAAGGSVVLVANADANADTLSDRSRAEQVTHCAGVSVPGAERLV